MKSIALYMHRKEQKNGQQDKGLVVEDNSDDNQSTEKEQEKKQPIGETQDNHPQPDEELHINIWKVEQGRFRLKPKLYIDFGIMTTFQNDEMCLYLPFQIAGEPIDLGHKLHNNRDMLCTVFNENYLIETQPDACYCSVKESENATRINFYLYNLGVDNMQTEEHRENEKFQGTFITLTCKGLNDNQNGLEAGASDKYYMRFRIEVKNIRDIAQSEFVSNDLLQAAFSKVDLYDIRINESREIHPKVTEKMRGRGFSLCKFSKVHLFYMADSREKIENGSALKSDSRILEEGKWKDYEPQNDLRNAVFLAHHWKRRMKDNDNTVKEQKPIKSFCLFFSTIYPHIQLSHLIAFFSVIILLGWIGGMLEFKMNQLFKQDLLSDQGLIHWIRPIFVILLFVFVIGYILKYNYGFRCRIYRKR